MVTTTPDLRALVTGASSGIGAAFARALRARGEKLILVARREDRLRELAAELGGDAAVAVVPADLAAPGAAERVMSAVAERGLTVDFLVNNAGVGHTGAFVDEPLERIRAMIDLNVRAVVELCRLALPGMVARGRGRLINVVSTSAFQPVPFLNVYGASKAFVLSFTEALATELKGTGIRIQALCPGLTRSEFHETAGTDKVRFSRTFAMEPEEVVAISLRALERGRLRVVAGWPNRLLAGLTRFAPLALSRRIAGELFRPSAQSSR
jgi:short-subunit dehydrogenase